jgi:hypothetical protein
MFFQEEQQPEKDPRQNVQLFRFDVGGNSQIDDIETGDWFPVV